MSDAIVEEAPVTLITGTRTGIGKALAEHYAGLDHRVIGCSRRTPEWSLPGYEHVALDVSDEREVVDLFAYLRTRFGKVDNLINNAALATMNHSFLTSAARARDIMNTNVVGTFLFCREAGKLMQERRYGRIVNLTSVAVPLKIHGEAAYAASKAAVNTLTEILAREFASFGITVNAVGPVPMRTGMNAGVPEEKMERVLALQTITRYSTIDDVTNVIDFYLRRESAFLTGQTIYLGGVSRGA